MSKTDKVTDWEFSKLFESARHGSSAFETWQAFVYMAAYDIANAVCQDVSPFRDIAETLSNKYDTGTMAALFSNLVESYEENPYRDLMGDTYMRLGIGNKAGGQFFTPYHVCRLMADSIMAEQDVNEKIDENGYITVLEPSCGSGANVVAACERLNRLGVNYQERLFAWANDVSEVTALMCYVQLSLIGCPAVVSVGDTLKMEYRYALKTPVLMTGSIWAARRMRGFEW